MNRPFLKSLPGKFFLRVALVTFFVTLIIAGLAIARLRSVANTANESVNAARGNLPDETVVSLETLADDIASASSTTTLILAALVVIGTIAVAALALSFARRVTAPITELRGMVNKSVAALPAFVEAHVSGSPELPEFPAVDLNTGDELEDLARSINNVQQTAAELAVGQTQTQQYDADRLVNLGRRSQSLLIRQMSLIDGMEKDEQNPSNLQRLFQIDHLATRMRRAAESMLVLANETSPRQMTRPILVHHVVQAASSEIEHFDRIAIADFAGVSVAGAVATDLAHLLAELLENATSFAAADATATVRGGATEHGYLVEIVDNGFGMEPHLIAAANERLAGRATEQHPGYLGHDVVARLAARHGIGVELTATPGAGVTARVHIPQKALAGAEDAATPHAAPTQAEAPQQVAPAPQAEAPQQVAPAPVTQAPVAAPAHVQAQPAQAQPVQAPPVQAQPVQAQPVQAQPVQAPPVQAQPAPNPVADVDLSDGLTPDQRAAIHWASDEEEASRAAAEAAQQGAGLDYASVGAPTELHAAPLDADSLAQMLRDTTDEL